MLYNCIVHTHTHTQHVFLFNISLKSLHIPKLTPACPTYSHIPLPSTYVQTLTCTQMVHMCNYPITPHMYTQTLMYTHLPTLVTWANTRSSTHNAILVCISWTYIWETTLCRPGLCPLSFLYVEPHCPLSTLIHFLSLGRVLRLLIASAT